MIANRIRELREAKGLSQDELGAKVGTNKFKVSRIETGETRLTLDLATKIAAALDVSVAEVLNVQAIPTARGLAEEAVSYVGGEGDPLARLADIERNRILYEIKSNALDELGIVAGDIVLIDMSADTVAKVKPLALVIAQVYSGTELLAARTVLRQFVPPALLVANSRSESHEPINMKIIDAHIKGIIVSHHRRLSGGLS
ncbi:MAG TPA: helix-turn-helix transcriptional regulator [Hyphomicrobiaceae bacterium]|nr:helix-turn-helix transcriptional regulator [Hyphomicrobiaceae bacterium]